MKLRKHNEIDMKKTSHPNFLPSPDLELNCVGIFLT
jgi:hypothetical protein